MHQLADIAALLSYAVEINPSRPLITYYDKDTGERTELSGTTLLNWVSKTANFLADDLDVSGGATVAVVLPPHWQTAAIDLAVWLLGAAVTDRALIGPHPLDVLVVPEVRLMELLDTPTRDIVVTALHPLGLGVQAKPDHVLDYAVEVRAHGDHFNSRGTIDPNGDALYAGGFELTHAALTGAAVQLADRLGITAADRVLIPVDGIQEAGPLMWLLAPLAVGASIVLVRFDEDPEIGTWLQKIADQERVSAALGIDLPAQDPSSGWQIRTLLS